MPQRVQAYRADAHLIARRTGGLLPQRGADPGQQFFNGEGLGDVIVRAGIQAVHLVHHGVPGGEQDHRGRFLPAEPAQHLESVQGRQHDIEQDQVEGIAQGGFQPFAPVEALAHAVSLVGQLKLHEAGQGFFIFDQQD